MRLWYLVVRQVSKSDNPENPENPENPGSDNSARTKHQINAKYACSIWHGHCGRETCPSPICYRCRKRLPQAYIALN